MHTYHITITCREQDADRFVALGFEKPSSEDGILQMEADRHDCEGEDMPTDVPWLGRSISGWYGAINYACDGKRLLQAESSDQDDSDDDYVIRWNLSRNQPNQREVASVRRFVALQKRVSRMFNL